MNLLSKTKFFTLIWTMAFWLSLGSKAQAQTPLLALPLDCEPGITCWIPNHVDMNLGPGVKDYACGSNTYNGHKGTDFAITNLKIIFTFNV